MLSAKNPVEQLQPWTCSSVGMYAINRSVV